MSILTAARIEKPYFFRIKPTTRGRGRRKAVVIGFDSEAIGGKPRLFQFSLTGDADMTMVYKLSTQTNAGLDCFTEFLDTYATRKDTEYIVVGFNLQYEFTQLFRDTPIDPITGENINTQSEFEIDYERLNQDGTIASRWHAKALAEKLFTVTFTHRGTKRRVKFIDAFKFYVTSLNKAAGMLNLGAKVELPDEYIGNLTEDQLDDPEFREYAKQDAYLTRRIGENIVELFKDYDVPTCISAPQFAARVFKHHFLDGEISLPSPDLEQAGLASYHGGKNGYYLDGPKHLQGLWSFDITSAYPEAMKAIPNPVTGQWFAVDEWQPGRHALYRVTMRYKPCRYRGAQAHDGSKIGGPQPSQRSETGRGQKISTTYVDGVWITSYELDAIMAHGEATLIAVAGFELRGESGGSLAAYVDRFFTLKRNSIGPVREAAKLFLNSLYGKFFQKTPLGTTGYWMIEGDDTAPYIVNNAGGEFDYRAGGLYHPPIASLITGFVRGKIHRLEHKYTSIMTSTDGFFARRKPDPADLGSDLGMLTAVKGDLSIWRERLYVFTNDSDKPKAALHGFRGKVSDLQAIPLTPGSFGYTAKQLVTLRLAGRTFTGADGTPVTPIAGEIPTLKFMLDIRGSPT